MNTTRRQLCTVMASLCAAPGVFAQAYPREVLKWIIPYPPGGGSDRLARALVAEMQPSFGQPIVMDYKPGAGTIVGAQAVANAKPDGYTIMSVDNATLVYNPFLHNKLAYDAERSFTPIGAIGRFPMALVVHPSTPAKTMAEFLTWAKLLGKPVDYSSPGVGSPHHINMEMFADRSGLAMRHIPYRGGAASIQSVLANETPTMMLDVLSGIELLRSGKLRAIALATSKRAASLPELPTMKEAGLPNLDLYAWQGVVGPAGLSNEVQSRLNQELNKALQSSAFQQQFKDVALEVMPGSAQQFADFAKAERMIWGKLIQDKKIVAE